MAKKRLGQHFLFDSGILSRIADSAALTHEDTVVEIGPGHGSLTRVLAGRVKRLVAIELDHELVSKLRREFAGYRNLEIINDDAVKFRYEDLGKFKVVANIPYYVTTPIIFRLLEARPLLETMTLTIQKEVAERIVAAPGSKDYGVLSIMIQYYSSPELKFAIPKEAFRPPPKVDSAVIHISLLRVPSVRPVDERMFFRVVRTAFSQRRKTLANSLKSLSPDIRQILETCGIDPSRRPETLAIFDFCRISDHLADISPLFRA